MNPDIDLSGFSEQSKEIISASLNAFEVCKWDPDKKYNRIYLLKKKKEIIHQFLIERRRYRKQKDKVKLTFLSETFVSLNEDLDATLEKEFRYIVS